MDERIITMVKKSRRTAFKVFAVAAVAALALFSLPACSQGANEDFGADASSDASGVISVVSREDGSGTRDAFSELMGIVGDDDIDNTTADAVITNSTSVMMTTVAGDPNAIGYISLGSLNDTVKAVDIDGIAPSTEAVKDGSYPVSRPFNVVTGAAVSDAAADFMAFVMSAEGQAAVEEEGYVSVNDAAADFKPAGVSGKVVVAGSSSVTPVMEKLAEAYEAINGKVTVEVQQSDSSTGIQSVSEGVCDLGMASRDLKDSEASSGVESTVIAMDGIAVIVNNESAVAGLSSEQVKNIYTGALTDWSEAA